MIVHNYLSDPREMREISDGLKILRKAIHQPALAELVGYELFPGDSCSSDASIHGFVREGATGCFQACGTCRMGDPNAAPTPELARQLVVDAELSVIGLCGLRVVDASIMPSITSGNLNAPIMMIAEHAAQLIADNYYK